MVGCTVLENAMEGAVHRKRGFESDPERERHMDRYLAMSRQEVRPKIKARKRVFLVFLLDWFSFRRDCV